MTNPFRERQPNIEGNTAIRTPQREAYGQLREHADHGDAEEREVGIVLPVGCGKSGTITLTPFAFNARRALVIAPGLPITAQLVKDFDPRNPDMFYRKCRVLDGVPYPEPVEIRGRTVNRGDLEEAHVVITNIHQLRGEENRWLQSLPSDFFDVIIFDEGHHSVAESWQLLKAKFPGAHVINFSATPLRADGQRMAGRILYSYPVAEAINQGYVKQLTAIQLNPRTLRYVRRADGHEIEVGLDEVRRLGEQDADFRKSIVTSEETLGTIVSASIRALEGLREQTGEGRLKIIAAALNYQHCIQVVEAYKARGMRAAYVHAREDGAVNKRVMGLLEAHELDVIVQIRKLGEGFDHKYLSVAAVFCTFANLSPFVQFVGRVMRVIQQNAPRHPLNQGVVIFHAGANVASLWEDFREFCGADQAYFEQLLPLEGLDPQDPRAEREIVPILGVAPEVEVRAQSEVQLEQMHLLDSDAAAAIALLKDRGLIDGNFDPSTQVLQPVPTTKVAARQAKRDALDARIRTAAGAVLARRGINPAGRDHDRQRLGRDNFVVMKSAIDRHVNAAVGKPTGQRPEFVRAELDLIEARLEELVAAAESEVFGGN